MGQILHGSATTIKAVRRAIQHSQESLRTRAKRYGINQKTVAKWKKRTSVTDLPTGAKEPVIITGWLRTRQSPGVPSWQAVRRSGRALLLTTITRLRRTVPATSISTSRATVSSSSHQVPEAQPLIRDAIPKGQRLRAHAFKYTCDKADIEHLHDQGKASVDQRSSREDEPHHQGRYRQALLL
jgi:hypothetical protein